MIPESNADVVVLCDEPYCAETRLDLQDDLVTPISRFYARNNFAFPGDWPGLTIDGAVERPQSLGIADLSRLDHRTLTATMECAGNGRAFMSPNAPGEQWRLGAVSTAEWRGIPLRDLLASAGVRPEAVEIQFRATDGFERSLPILVALAPETLVVLGMNGTELPVEHGGPVRLLVPGWYGMSAVKWLTRIVALTEPFRGHFQVERYVIDGRPVREMEVRAIITAPATDATVRSTFTVRGLAWTGRGAVSLVEVSADGGRSWMAATIFDSSNGFTWVRWSCQMDGQPLGSLQLVSRATDSTGRIQPLASVWNALGYCNNAAQPVSVFVE